ncbi:MAG TPA: ECF-type sigma factor [Phycisphaerales bacterium]|nr:ECF-type sigma factor [Phycisphaerales bacterium]
MSEPTAFSAFLARAAQGDPAQRDRAYAELLRWVRIVVRAEMGRRLRDHRESVDVCQSIARSFVDDFQSGRVRFESERALAAYLRVAVRSKLAELARRDRALKRGAGEHAVPLHGATEAAADERDPPDFSAESWARLRESLADDDRHLAELRMRGLDWATIAEQLGTSEAAARQRFSRLMRTLREERRSPE